MITSSNFTVDAEGSNPPEGPPEGGESEQDAWTSFKGMPSFQNRINSISRSR